MNQAQQFAKIYVQRKNVILYWLDGFPVYDTFKTIEFNDGSLFKVNADGIYTAQGILESWIKYDCNLLG